MGVWIFSTNQQSTCNVLVAYNRLELYIPNAYCYYVLGDHREPAVFKTGSTRHSGVGERQATCH